MRLLFRAGRLLINAAGRAIAATTGCIARCCAPQCQFVYAAVYCFTQPACRRVLYICAEDVGTLTDGQSRTYRRADGVPGPCITVTGPRIPIADVPTADIEYVTRLSEIFPTGATQTTCDDQRCTRGNTGLYIEAFVCGAPQPWVPPLGWDGVTGLPFGAGRIFVPADSLPAPCGVYRFVQIPGQASGACIIAECTGNLFTIEDINAIGFTIARIADFNFNEPETQRLDDCSDCCECPQYTWTVCGVPIATRRCCCEAFDDEANAGRMTATYQFRQVTRSYNYVGPPCFCISERQVTETITASGTVFASGGGYVVNGTRRVIEQELCGTPSVISDVSTQVQIGVSCPVRIGEVGFSEGCGAGSQTVTINCKGFERQYIPANPPICPVPELPNGYQRFGDLLDEVYERLQVNYTGDSECEGGCGPASATVTNGQVVLGSRSVAKLAESRGCGSCRDGGIQGVRA